MLLGIWLDRVCTGGGSCHPLEMHTLKNSGTEPCGGAQQANWAVWAVKCSHSLDKANTALTSLRVGTGAGACVLAAAVPASALPQRELVKPQTNSGGFIPARRLKPNQAGRQQPQKTWFTKSGSHSLAFSKGPFLWKAGVSSHWRRVWGLLCNLQWWHGLLCL